MNESKQINAQKKFEDKYSVFCKEIDKYVENDTAVAFSGGVDSSVILLEAVKRAKKINTKVYAVNFQTELHPVTDAEIAKKVAEEIGAEFFVIKVDELAEAGIENNPVDRCYLCKKTLFIKLINFAKEHGCKTVIEGSNADDELVYRPGMKAVKELGVKSPLLTAGMNKNDVRRYALENRLSVASRPSTPCLATRLPYNTRISENILERIECGEKIIRNILCDEQNDLQIESQFNVRLRVHGDIARIETDECAMYKLLNRREKLIASLKDIGFNYISLDLEGFRSGSMDINISSYIHSQKMV